LIRVLDSARLDLVQSILSEGFLLGSDYPKVRNTVSVVMRNHVEDEDGQGKRRQSRPLLSPPKLGQSTSSCLGRGCALLLAIRKLLFTSTPSTPSTEVFTPLLTIHHSAGVIVLESSFSLSSAVLIAYSPSLSSSPFDRHPHATSPQYH
jgi:hypothetical protein